MDKRHALKILIENSDTLTAEKRAHLLAKIPSLHDDEVIVLGRYFAEEHRENKHQAHLMLGKIDNMIDDIEALRQIPQKNKRDSK